MLRSMNPRTKNKNALPLVATLLFCSFLCGCVVCSTEKDGVTTVKGIGLDISIYPDVGMRLGVFEHQTTMQTKE